MGCNARKTKQQTTEVVVKRLYINSSGDQMEQDQWCTQDFFSGRRGSTNSAEDRGQNGDRGAVAP
jgi:hypothetical protein